MTDRGKECCKAAGVTAAGAAVGKAVVVAKGATAIGVLGKGAGIGGTTAGPVGAAAGAVIALAGYGLYRLIRG